MPHNVFYIAVDHVDENGVCHPCTPVHSKYFMSYNEAEVYLDAFLEHLPHAYVACLAVRDLATEPRAAWRVQL